MGKKNSKEIHSIIKTLCRAENEDVVLRFDGPLDFPSSKYDGRSYQTETLPKATLNATISRASIEDCGDTLFCTGAVSTTEMDRVGINPSVVWTDGEGESESCGFNLNATRQWWLDEDEYSELTREEVQKAIEENREEEVLPPWDEPPVLVVNVERTSECAIKHYDSGYSIQYSAPEHEVCSLIDVRIK